MNYSLPGVNYPILMDEEESVKPNKRESKRRKSFNIKGAVFTSYWNMTEEVAQTLARRYPGIKIIPKSKLPGSGTLTPVH